MLLFMNLSKEIKNKERFSFLMSVQNRLKNNRFKNPLN